MLAHSASDGRRGVGDRGRRVHRPSPRLRQRRRVEQQPTKQQQRHRHRRPGRHAPGGHHRRRRRQARRRRQDASRTTRATGRPHGQLATPPTRSTSTATTSTRTSRPAASCTFAFPAKIDGRFVVELEDAREQLANARGRAMTRGAVARARRRASPSLRHLAAPRAASAHGLVGKPGPADPALAVRLGARRSCWSPRSSGSRCCGPSRACRRSHERGVLRVPRGARVRCSAPSASRSSRSSSTPGSPASRRRRPT